MINNLEDHIRARAHAIWEAEGRPDGRSEEHWHRASEEVTLEGMTPKSATKTKKPAAPRKTTARKAKTAAPEASAETVAAAPKRAPRAQAAASGEETAAKKAAPRRRTAKAKTDSETKTV